MKIVSRRETILERIKRNGTVSVVALAREFGVAQMTVRRDLLEMERKGLLIRRYGGAVRSEASDRIFSFTERMGLRKVEKRVIGEKAASFIVDNETVIIDCGSTPYQISPNLKNRKNLRVVTNSIPVVMELILYPAVRLFLLGGEFLNDRRASCGHFTEQMLSSIRADKAFIGADGVSLSGGLSAHDEREGKISQKMAERAREVFLICDSSKLEKDSYFPFMSLAQIKGIVTDSGVDKSLIKTYAKHGIKIFVA